MNITLEMLKQAVNRIAIACEQFQPMLCEADSRLGDGDLGITMQKGWRQIADDSQDWPDDLSKALFQCSKSLQKACASSFGTLQATAFMAMAKYCKENQLQEISSSDISPLLTVAYQSMMERGKGELGQKSVLDILYHLSEALKPLAIDDLKIAALQSIESTLNEFRQKPNLLGRARMFPEKSIGLDDPGMLAIKVIVEAI
ncbi:dihydroxyacetone kinase subunit L [Proteus faecis]|uniref:Dihydroxyacetone kinase subunit L n=1 Tax=Proteus faecis TaxID=2050967 RepID=A0AAW7CJ96_9GAMM|nr:dihydroxyacetone kinase subunit L [Proteus faecis]MDL5166270.1 dihydroxyacetone kinase subunit L [Proteus faecis]MDL5273466.1 dihydroxyacetone kinase subunit L [Proteus faecis]MDL5277036.1 dihydroxyacetone kinase subunit L [Proteus faecis]MDL5306026.1 dihydroxyacetone kinase subunit L [Proteus faecis]MDL5309593.1 dihydroxyacetone kinase subunit L [Proteus faecis]